jgi:hypothetical protein
MRGEAAFDVEAVHQDSMATALTDQPDVGPDAGDSPLAAATRVRLAQRDSVANAQVDRGHD